VKLDVRVGRYKWEDPHDLEIFDSLKLTNAQCFRNSSYPSSNSRNQAAEPESLDMNTMVPRGTPDCNISEQ
jgi:hypothetical protein